MNIYEYAMKVEKDGELYYRNLAEKSSDVGLKKIFTLLANQEVKHYNVLKKMSGQDEFCVSDYETFDDEKTIYETLEENKGRLQFPIEEVQYYEEAISHEEDMSNYYLEKAAQSNNDAEKHILTQIAHEEAKHKIILQDILDYIQEGDNLVGSAEF